MGLVDIPQATQVRLLRVLQEGEVKRVGANDTMKVAFGTEGGLFVCAGCSLPVFTSAMKFDSGTGWPSFFTSIPNHFATSQDHKMILARTEYHCVRCGGHHGHVFDDGPAPTHQRWCNNGVSLRFIPTPGKAA